MVVACASAQEPSASEAAIPAQPGAVDARQWNYLQPGVNTGVRPAYAYDNAFPDHVQFQQPATFNGVIQPFPSVGLHSAFHDIGNGFRTAVKESVAAVL